MKKSYTVNLINSDGCNFDGGEFSSIRAARKWAAGRGQTYSFGCWNNYRVVIERNGETVADYRTH